MIVKIIFLLYIVHLDENMYKMQMSNTITDTNFSRVFITLTT